MKKILNIILGVMLAITVVLTAMTAFGAKDVSGNPDVNMIIVWTYVLFAAAIVAAVGGAVFGMLQNPKGAKSSLVSVVLLAVVVGIAFAMADGTTPMTLSDKSVVDDPMVLTVSDVSIFVAYIAMAVAVVAAIFAEIKSVIK